jgi:hypothetical protein
MFKGFQNNRRSNGFNSFPALNFQMNNEAYGFSGCSFWLDAAYGLNTQTDLAAVSFWQPRIGSYNFTQTTVANQPRLVKNDVSFNNLPTIEFNASAKNLTIPNSNSMTLGNTIAVIAKYDSLQAFNCVIRTNSTGGGIYWGGTSAGYEGPTWRSPISGAVQIASLADSSNTQIAVFTPERIYVNGSQTNTGTATGFNTGLQTLGAPDTSTLYGRIAEIVAFNFVMTTSQISLLSDNINSKYAVY